MQHKAAELGEAKLKAKKKKNAFCNMWIGDSSESSRRLVKMLLVVGWTV